jgi:hypothetical protein
MPDNDDIQVHEGRRVGAVVSLRLKPDEAELLSALAARDGRTLSETLRLALHSFARTPRREADLVVGGPTISYTRGGESADQTVYTW